MITASILRSNLGAQLDRALSGERLAIVRHGRQIAALVPFDASLSYRFTVDSLDMRQRHSEALDCAVSGGRVGLRRHGRMIAAIVPIGELVTPVQLPLLSAVL